MANTKSQPPRILVVEDEPLILMELAFAIEDLGAASIAANSVERALAEIEAGPPDAAILDVNLGRGATCEPVADHLRRLQVPFLIHSGDLLRQGELIARIDAEVIAKPAASTFVAERAKALTESSNSHSGA